MPVTLRIRDDLSINDIVYLGLNHLVEVTPHVGNWTPARLVLPKLGIKVLCVDHTIGCKDINAHPHLLIHEGKAHELCDFTDRLTTHSSVTKVANSGMHQIGKSLSEVHIGTVRSLYPNADILTHCEYLKKCGEITLEVLEETTRYSRTGTWWRRVSEDGVVSHFRSKNLPKEWCEYEPDIFPLTNKKGGWLIHNRISILMDVILQSRMGKEPEIYHLSGPDMVRYLGNEIDTISEMYDHTRKRFGFKQEVITFNLVPFASFRFASRTSQTHACTKLCEEVGNPYPNDARLKDYIRDALDVLAESETKDYFTQHDLVSSGEEILVPEIACNWSMRTCAAHLAKIKSLL